MKYQFILTYTPTDGISGEPRTCHPVYGDSLCVTISRENDEWYYKRKLDGEISFEREDYLWIMQRPFDGTFAIEIQYTNDGTNWLPYFDGTFSRANLTIDEDNQKATLTSLIEGVYNAIENGKDEDYDLMKIIPDAAAREVQGQVHPALAMVDYNSETINTSDMFCDSSIVGAGYKAGENDWVETYARNWLETGGIMKGMDNIKVENTSQWRLCAICGEAEVKMSDASSVANGCYRGFLHYKTIHFHYPDGGEGDNTTVVGRMNCDNGCYIDIDFHVDEGSTWGNIHTFVIYNPSGTPLATISEEWLWTTFSPSGITIENNPLVNKLEIYFHYIRATLLTQDGGNTDNVLDTGGYYQRMSNFQPDGGLQIYASSNTTDTPNGHRLVPGTGEQGTTPQYFAPPVGVENCIPLAEANWHYSSLWYTITPSVANGLLDPTKIGSFRWTRCWTLGTVLRYLLDRITDGKVIFTEDTTASQFLYSTVNPVNQHEPFDYLITQKSNVMNPGQGDSAQSAARCPVRLNWFLSLLRNAFNCYYWLEKQNDGRYLFRIDHVEYCRRGGHYDQTLPVGINLPEMKPLRNFRDYDNQLRKTYADQTNKYSYDLDNMVEKYTFSWQGDGGSDAFKGNPMFFKAGWVEPSSSEDHQVDNIFADLAWLMLNSGTDTASSKNFEGVFLFAGYKPAVTDNWTEDTDAAERYLVIGQYGSVYTVPVYVWLTASFGNTITVELLNNDTQSVTTLATYTGTGNPQMIEVNLTASPTYNFTLRVNFGSDRWPVIHRVHAADGNVYRVPNVTDLLSPTNSLQNGPLAWPWLQNEHLHYDIPANKWSFKHDTLQETNTANDWETNGTVKMVQKQEVKAFPIPEKSTEDAIMTITGIHTSIEGGKTGIITNAKVNLSSRNAELTIIYDPVPQQQ